MVTDVSDVASVRELRDRALDRFGAVHVVHNNAGIGLGGPIWEVSEEDWRWILGVNLWGVIHGIATFVPLFVEQGEGHVVNTASIAGLTTAPFLGPYNATKQAVVAISETLFKDLQAVGAPVGVSVLCPGFVQTRIAESDRNRPAVGARSRGRRRGGAARRHPGAWSTAASRRRRGRPGHRRRADDTFYILTHPELTEAITTRFDDIVQGRPPTRPSSPDASSAPAGGGTSGADAGSGLNGCTVTQQVPCGLWFVFSLHCDDGGTLLWILTTWYWVGP